MGRTGILGILVFSLFLSPAVFAQEGIQWRGGGGWGAGTPYNRMYDPKTVETITGEVVSISKITPMKGMGYGVHLMVKTDKETISVHLGPGWYVENQDTEIKPKDRIEVTGSRVTFEEEPAIIASELKKGDKVLKLRNEKGVPLWSGWRSKQRK